MAESSSRSRRTLSSRKSAALSACERLKQIKKGERERVELTEEKMVYEMVDEHEYAEMVIKRQKDDWIDDDDGIGGYVEDGREVFDDEVDEEEDYEDIAPRRKRMKVNRTKQLQAEKDDDEDDEDEEGVRSHNIRDMFRMMSAKPVKRRRQVDEKPCADTEALLESIIGNLKSNDEPIDETNNVIAPMKLKRKQEAGPRSSLARSSATKERAAVARKRARNLDITFDDILPNLDQAGDDGPEDDEALFDDDDNFDNVAAAIKSQSTKKADGTSKLSEEIRAKIRAFETKAMEDDEEEEESQNLSTLNTSIPTELDGELPFYYEGDDKTNKYIKLYWLDAFENANTPGVVYLFGKVYVKSLNKYVSCCVEVKNIKRRMFILPNEIKGQPIDLDDVHHEFKMLTKKLKVKEFQSKKVKKSYAFDKQDVPNGLSDYLEVLMPPTANIPTDTKGESFGAIFGANQSFLERLLIDKKFQGPGWIRLKNPVLKSSARNSWCNVEFEIDALSKLSYDAADTTPAPPLVLMSLNIKTFVNPKTRESEVIAVGCSVDHSYNIEKGSSNNKRSWDTHFCLVTKPSLSSGLMLPLDLNVKNKNQNNKSCGTTLEIKTTERELLNYFLVLYHHKIDPDIVIGHDVQAFDFETLVNRMARYEKPSDKQVATWSKLGRLRRYGQALFKTKRDRANVTAGRIVADLKISAKELIRAKSYDLPELAHQIKNKNLHNLGEFEVGAYYEETELFFKWIKNIMDANRTILICMQELCALPLALQITKIAGNLLSRTLLGGRSERNEYLLLHSFYEKDYILPDKNYMFNKGGKFGKKSIDAEDAGEPADENDNTEAAGKSATKPKKAQYSGGLVLDPKIGYYKDFVLILDFNSLYPSIMREYNICFTTVDFRDILANPKNEDGEDRLPQIPDGNADPGILPTEITKLVEKRREVKKALQNPNISADMKVQLDIKQKALKLTANSMYGCLGFGNSRFYAKPLAALITAQGRRILLNTKELVEKAGYEVIYGDTDSIMINTKCNDYDEAHRVANIVKEQVNCLYKHLEIDCDGVLKCMLLLKKKKYAALVACRNKQGDRIVYTQELKGLDIVRRDWSELAREVGTQVCGKILNHEQTLDEILDEINKLLMDCAARIRSDQYELRMFEISKQLTKNPEEYTDKKNLCHVMVAQRYNESNKDGRKLRAGDVVQYVICTRTSNENNWNGLPATQRAVHPDEIRERPDEYKPDIKYYLSQQVHPVVSRLCDPIEGIDAVIIAEMLGLDDFRPTITATQSSGYTRDTLPFDRKSMPDIKIDLTKMFAICRQTFRSVPKKELPELSAEIKKELEMYEQQEIDYAPQESDDDDTDEEQHQEEGEGPIADSVPNDVVQIKQEPPADTEEQA